MSTSKQLQKVEKVHLHGQFAALDLKTKHRGGIRNRIPMPFVVDGLVFVESGSMWSREGLSNQ